MAGDMLDSKGVAGAMAGTEGATSKTATFSEALASWKEIDLVQLVKSLEGQTEEIIGNQKDNFVNRKKLADLTRDFKKQPENAKPSLYKSLLKSYQSEIDALTSRGKVAENAFLALAAKVMDAPDPYPLLEATVEQTARAEECSLWQNRARAAETEIQDLKKTIETYKKSESALLKVKEKAESAAKKVDETIASKLAAKEQEMEAIFDERTMNQKERQESLTTQVQKLTKELVDLRAQDSAVQTKLLSASQSDEHALAGKMAELDVLQSELEQSRAQTREMERRNERLRAEFEAYKSGEQSQIRIEQLQASLEESEDRSGRLAAQVEALQAKLKDASLSDAPRLNELRKELDVVQAECSRLRARVKSMADYDEIKRELEIIRFVEFAGSNLDIEKEEVVNEQSVDSTDAIGSARTAPKLEILLMQKNKALVDNLATMRVANEEAKTELRQMAAKLKTIEGDLLKERTLTEKLEEDLANLNSLKITQSQSAETSDPLTSFTVAARSLPERAPSPGGSSTPTSSSAILPIITSQRDRFRARNVELEEELRKQFLTLSEVRGELAKLQADNLKLYEKVRYLQSYDARTGHTGNGIALQNGRHDPRNKAATSSKIPSADEEAQYQAAYEDSIGPFERFKGREQNRAYDSLNPLEKVLLFFTRLVFAKRVWRLAFVVYSFVLHIVILVLIFQITSHHRLHHHALTPANIQTKITEQGLGAQLHNQPDHVAGG